MACSVADCSNSVRNQTKSAQIISFPRFPESPEVCKVWLVKCKRRDPVNTATARICSVHFLESDYERDLQNELLGLPSRRILKLTAVPSIFPFRTTASNTSTDRHSRLRNRKERQARNAILTEIENSESGVNAVVTGDVYCDPDEYVIDQLTEERDSDKALNEALMKIDEQGREISDLKNVILRQRTEILKLNVQIRELKRTKQKSSSVRSITSELSVFSPAQLKQMSGQKRVHWSPKDITKALKIRSVSLKAYRTAQENLKIPLPSLRTLRRWSGKFICPEGILEDVLSSLHQRSEDMNPFSLLTVISFDEMALDGKYVIDPTYEKLSSHSKVQVAMIRGLCDQWKQPIYYRFNTDMTKIELEKIILAVEDSGFKVCAFVCDLGAENRSLIKSLGITEEKTYINNPKDHQRQIYYFADVPHCLKNIRNHLLDQGAILSDGTLVDKSLLYQMLMKAGAELKLCPGLTSNSLELNGAERMRVRPAAQLLSHRVATLAWRCFPHKRCIGDFFECINNGFDVLNSRCTMDSKQNLRSGFGINLESQCEALSKLKSLITELRFRTPKGNPKKALLPCQTGFIISINSLISMFKYLKESEDIKYILASRLNQDCLESFFSRIRSLGGATKPHPSPPEFRFRLRLAILGSQTTPPKGSNVDDWEKNGDFLANNLLTNTNSISRVSLNKILEVEVLKNLDNMAWKPFVLIDI